MHFGIPSNTKKNRFWCESYIRANIRIYGANLYASRRVGMDPYNDIAIYLWDLSFYLAAL